MTQTISFSEKRSDKIRGVRKPFKGHFLNELQRDHYIETKNRVQNEHLQSVLKAQNNERAKVMRGLEKSIHHFNIQKFGTSLRDDITDTLTRVNATKQDSDRFFTEVLDFIQSMTD